MTDEQEITTTEVHVSVSRIVRCITENVDPGHYRNRVLEAWAEYQAKYDVLIWPDHGEVAVDDVQRVLERLPQDSFIRSVVDENARFSNKPLPEYRTFRIEYVSSEDGSTLDTLDATHIDDFEPKPTIDGTDYMIMDSDQISDTHLKIILKVE